MIEQLVSFETAKLAKENGFDWNNFTHNGYTFTNQPCYKNNTQELVRPKFYNENNPHIPAPTQDVLMRWIRNKHSLFIKIDFFLNDKINLCFDYCVADLKNPFKEGDIEDNYVIDYSIERNFNSPEEALEEALYKSLLLIKNK